MKHRRTLAAVLTTAALALAGCGEDEMGGMDHGSRDDQQFNDADVAFAQGMIPHHQQAIEMAALAEDRAASPEVKELAAAIEAAQGPEIETITGWLEAWGEEVPGDDMSGMDHDGTPGEDMPGMMSQEDMDMLEAATGNEFAFLTMMIDHHEGAIEMAETEQAEGENPGAIELAEKIETDQKAEIETMLGLL